MVSVYVFEAAHSGCHIRKVKLIRDDRGSDLSFPARFTRSAGQEWLNY